MLYIIYYMQYYYICCILYTIYYMLYAMYYMLCTIYCTIRYCPGEAPVDLWSAPAALPSGAARSPRAASPQSESHHSI